MSDDDTTKNRRTVLKAITAGAVSATAFATGGSAEPAPKSTETAEAFARFGDRETIDGLFEAHGRPVAAELSARGYVPAETNPVESVVSLHEYGRSDEGGLATVTTGSRDGTDVVDVRVRQVTDDAEVEYHVHPGMEDSYALVYPNEGEEGDVIFADGTTDGFSTSSSCCECSASGCGDTRCSDTICDCNLLTTVYYEERKCCLTTTGGRCLCAWERNGCECAVVSQACKS